MASLFIRHRVADFGKWKQAFDEHETIRWEFGITSHSVHRDADDPNIVIVAGRTPDVAHAREFIASRDLRSAMDQAGVIGPAEIWVAEDVEDGAY